MRFSRTLAAVSASLLLVAGCSNTPRLRYAEVESEAVGDTIGYAVWTPVDLRPDESLPMLVFLHGGADDETCFDEAEVGQALDRALAAGEIPRAVIVVPDGRLGLWENWYDGSASYRDWVIHEVMPRVQAELGTQPCPEGCHVAGASMGGHGALRFALFAPESFASVASLSGLVLDTEGVQRFADSWFGRVLVPFDRIWGPIEDREVIERNDIFRRWRSQEDLRGLRLMVAWAEHDRRPIIETNEQFRRHLLDRRIEHEHVVFQGRHSWKSWTPVISQVLRFAVWGSIDASPPEAEG